MTPGGKPPDDTEVILSRNVSDADRLTKRPRTPVTRPPRPASCRRPRFSFFSFTCQRTEEQSPSNAKAQRPRKTRRFPSPRQPKPDTEPQKTARQPVPTQRKPPSSFTPRTYGSETRRPQDQTTSVEDPIRSASRPDLPVQSPGHQRQNRPPAPRRRSAAVDGRVIGPPRGGVNTTIQKTVTNRKPPWLQYVAGTRPNRRHGRPLPKSWSAALPRSSSCVRIRPPRPRARAHAGNSRGPATMTPGFARRTAVLIAVQPLRGVDNEGADPSRFGPLPVGSAWSARRPDQSRRRSAATARRAGRRAPKPAARRPGHAGPRERRR
jgi:hypothetical protein